MDVKHQAVSQPLPWRPSLISEARPAGAACAPRLLDALEHRRDLRARATRLWAWQGLAALLLCTLALLGLWLAVGGGHGPEGEPRPVERLEPRPAFGPAPDTAPALRAQLEPEATGRVPAAGSGAARIERIEPTAPRAMVAGFVATPEGSRTLAPPMAFTPARHPPRVLAVPPAPRTSLPAPHAAAAAAARKGKLPAPAWPATPLPRDAPLATAPAASPPPSGLGEGSALDAEAELLRTIIDWHERHPHQPSNDRLLEHSGR